jgi:hypothetical protein
VKVLKRKEVNSCCTQKRRWGKSHSQQASRKMGSNCSDVASWVWLREESKAWRERMETVSHPDAKKASQSQTGLTALGAAGPTADRARNDQGAHTTRAERRVRGNPRDGDTHTVLAKTSLPASRASVGGRLVARKADRAPTSGARRHAAAPCEPLAGGVEKGVGQDRAWSR